MTDESNRDSIDYQDIVTKGLWKNNPALVQVLGLCPLLAVSASVVNALGLGLATLMVLTASNIAVSLIRHQISDTIRLPAFVMIIASLVSCIELLMKAYTYELYQILGIFIPLIVTNCAVLGRAETFASKNRVLPAALDGFMMGLGFTLVLVCVGIIRELLGTGMIFNNMQLLFGPRAASWTLDIFGQDYPQMILALLPPGAFIVVGFLMAAKNYIDHYLKQKKATSEPSNEIIKGGKRVRTTGTVA
ncbi:MAG: electron transport complex subunit E [Gammaproteobacteria bacterium]|nr:MAG: electron transport complex subunit E [Gammaproteobacteria bacterium]